MSVAMPADRRSRHRPKGPEATLSGSVRDKTGTLLADATVTVKNEKTGEERDGQDQRAGLLPVGNAEAVASTPSARRAASFAPLEYTGHAARRRPGDVARLRAEARRRVGDGDGDRPTALVLDLSSARIGVNVSEREVQNLPVNGRQMSQLMLQAPGSQNAGTGTWQDIRFSGRAVEQNAHPLRRHRRLGHHRRGAGQPERRDPDAVQAAGEPRERAGVPRRVEQLPGRVRHRHRRPGQRRHQVGQQRCSTARCSSTTATTSSTRRTTSTRRAGLPKSTLQSEPVRRIVRRPAREGPRVLLRQLRRLPA